MRNRCLPVFPKVDAASPRGLMAPPGLTALGAKGSVRDRLTPPRRVEGFALGEVYSTAALAMWAPLHYRRRPLMKKPLQPPCGRWKCIPPLVAGATTLPGGKHVTGFAGRLQLTYESSSFATPASGGTITRAYCRAIYEESVSRCFILPPLAGEVRRSPDRGCICRRQIIQQNAYFAI